MQQRVLLKMTLQQFKRQQMVICKQTEFTAPT